MYLMLSSILTKSIKRQCPLLSSIYGENWFILGAVVSCWRGKDASLSGCKVSRKAAQRLYQRYEEVSWVRVSNKRLRDKHFYDKWTNFHKLFFLVVPFVGDIFGYHQHIQIMKTSPIILTFVKFSKVLPKTQSQMLQLRSDFQNVG